MKNKITAFLLSVVLCLSLAGSAFAAELTLSDSIAITGAAGDSEVVVVVSGLTGGEIYSACTLTHGRGSDWTPITTVGVKAKDDGTWKKTISGLPELQEGDVVRFNMPTLGLYGTLEIEKKDEKVTVNFDVNKPSGAAADVAGLTASSKVIDKGTAIGTLPVLTLDGYTFQGWNTKADGSGDKVTDATTFSANATIYAQWEKKQDQDQPVEPKPETVKVTGVTLNRTSATIEEGSTLRLSATVKPSDASNKKLVWTSSNTDVATVNANGVVTAIRAGRAVITVTTEDGGFTAACEVTVTAKRQDNNHIYYPIGGGVSGGGNGSGTPSINSSAKPSAPSAPDPDGTVVRFTDVPAGHTFAADITYVAQRGWMGGYSDGSFRPGANTTRQALWMVLARIDGANPADMAAARAWAMANGISDGTNPTSNMSRQQMVTMLYRYAQMKGYSTAGGVSVETYPDAAQIAGYAKDALSWAIGGGIMNGTSDGKLNPAGTASRAHFAAFLHRFANHAGL